MSTLRVFVKVWGRVRLLQPDKRGGRREGRRREVGKEREGKMSVLFDSRPFTFIRDLVPAVLVPSFGPCIKKDQREGLSSGERLESRSLKKGVEIKSTIFSRVSSFSCVFLPLWSTAGVIRQTLYTKV